MNGRRFILTLYLAVFLGLGVTGAVLFANARAEYRILRSEQEANERRLSEAQARLRQEQTILQRLRTDPAYVEREIRRRLGYIRPDEAIYRFEE